MTNEPTYEEAMAENPTEESWQYDLAMNLELVERIAVVVMNKLIKTHKQAQLDLLVFDKYTAIAQDLNKLVTANRKSVEANFSKDVSRKINYMRTANAFLHDILSMLSKSGAYNPDAISLFTDILTLKINEVANLNLVETKFSDEDEIIEYKGVIIRNLIDKANVLNPDVPLYVIESEGSSLTTHTSREIRVASITATDEGVLVGFEEGEDILVPYEDTFRMLTCNSYKSNPQGQRISEKLTGYKLMLNNGIKLERQD